MHRRLRIAPLLLCAGLGFAAPARAQVTDPQKASAAQILFDQATDEMEKKAFAKACPRLEEATKLVPDALGARMALGECYEGLGRLASAWSQFAMVEGLASKARQAERAEAAGKRAAELKPKLATLTIDLAGALDGLPGLTVTRDGLDVGAAQRGVAFPADVGSHVIVVAAPGYKPWKKTVEILADGAKTTIRVPMLVVDPLAGAGAPVVRSEPVRPWQMPLSIGALAAGGAGLAVGAVLGGLAIAKNKESNQKECNAHNQCTDAGLALRNKALSFGTGSTASFIAGGVLAAAGATLIFTAPARARDKAGPKAGASGTVALGLTATGLQLEGTF